MSKSRDELRRELRQKIKNKRNPSNTAQTLAKNVKQDPQTALMSMGIDDADVLNNAKMMLKDPKTMLKALTDQLADEATGSNANQNNQNKCSAIKEVKYEERKEEEEEEEGLPPPMI